LDSNWGCPTGHRIPVIKGIPRFVDASNYAAAFGVQWLRHQRTQLDSYTGTTLSRDRARHCLGERRWGDLADSVVVECGCGDGLFTEGPLEQQAHVMSIDLSLAVEANQANFPQDERHRIAQADLRALPFPPQAFDIVFCLGVVQHPP